MSNKEIKFTKLHHFITSSSIQMVDSVYFGENDGTVHKIYVGFSVDPNHHIAFIMHDVKNDKQIVGISTGVGPTKEDDDFVGYYSVNLI